MGMITPDGPTKEQMDNEFSFTLVGTGWDKSVAPTSDGQYSSPPDKKLVLKVRMKSIFASRFICI